MKKLLVAFTIAPLLLSFYVPFLVSAETTRTERVENGLNVVTITNTDSNGIVINKTDNTYVNNAIIVKTTTWYQPNGETIKSKSTETYDYTGKNRLGKKVSVYDTTGQIVTKETLESFDSKTGILTEQKITTMNANGEVISSTNQLANSTGQLLPNTETDTSYLTKNCNFLDSSAGCYEPLAPIKGPDGNKIDTKSFPTYLQAIYRIGIGACFVLGVIMFTWAGIEYIVSESMDTKSDAKKRIRGALIGLAIALVSYILLQTINPDLLKFNDLNVAGSATTQ